MQTNYNTLHINKQSLKVKEYHRGTSTMTKKERIDKVYSMLVLKEQTIDEVAENLGVSTSTIYRDIQDLKREEKIPEDYSVKHSMSKEELENRICVFASKGKNHTVGEAATKLQLSEVSVHTLVKKLKKEGRISQDFSFRHAATNEELKDRIFFLATVKKQSTTEIAHAVGISSVTVREYIAKLKREGKLPEDFTTQRNVFSKDLEEKIYVLAFMERYEAADIAMKLKITSSTVYTCIRKLKDAGRVPLDFSFKQSKEIRKQQLKDKICASIKQQEPSIEDIIRDLGISTKMTYRYIKELENEGRIPKNFMSASAIPKKELKNKIYSLALIQKQSANAISNKLGVSLGTIYKYINELKEKGEIPKDFSFSISTSKKALKDKICSLILTEKQNKSEISRKLGIPGHTVYSYIEELKEENRIPYDFSFSFFMSARKLEDRVYTLAVVKRLSVSSIVRELEVNHTAVYQCIHKLKKDGRIPKEFEFKMSDAEKEVKESKQKAKDEVCSLILSKNMKTLDIANKLGVHATTIRSYIKELKQEKRIPSDFSPTLSMSKSVFKKKICSRILKNKTFTEIGKEVGVSPSTIGVYCKQLQKEGKIPQDFFFKDKKKQEDKLCFLVLNKGLSAKEIAKELGISDVTVYKRVKDLKEKGKIPLSFSFKSRLY